MQEERLLSGYIFSTKCDELMALKRKAHNLSFEYNMTLEGDARREEILNELIGSLGEKHVIQGPIFFHYGKHTTIGKNFFANFNLTIQDDAYVTIGDDCDFGPGTTIVTPIHPLLPGERKIAKDDKGQPCRIVHAEPVHIGNCCWFGANVTVLPGVTIGDNCVIGAGSVVSRDIPANSLAMGVPARVVRTISEKDSVLGTPELLKGFDVYLDENGKPF